MEQYCRASIAVCRPLCGEGAFTDSHASSEHIFVNVLAWGRRPRRERANGRHSLHHGRPSVVQLHSRRRPVRHSVQRHSEAEKRQEGLCPAGDLHGGDRDLCLRPDLAPALGERPMHASGRRQRCRRNGSQLMGGSGGSRRGQRRVRRPGRGAPKLDGAPLTRAGVPARPAGPCRVRAVVQRAVVTARRRPAGGRNPPVRKQTAALANRAVASRAAGRRARAAPPAAAPTAVSPRRLCGRRQAA
mmetsp:Transcript_5741/g.24241  ORF Transcript_5741/g.24241 Transcript_5741/m.24241 type:complete len:244 (-) Transcript_5741:880-1611(-)